MSTYSMDTDSIYSEDDVRPPMRLCARPPQFPQGKTKTSLDEMNKMMSWFLDSAHTFNASHPRSKDGRIVHLIFVNNNLIEGDQWRDRMVKRGIQNLKIFSSKSDVNDVDRLLTLITQGEYDAMNDEYIPIDYVLMCTHPIRLQNICNEKTGDSLLKRLERFNPNISIVPWFDEIDKFVKLHTDFIPRFQGFSNVLVLNGITATPYGKFWQIMHECNYRDIDLIGKLPDPKDYRTIEDHELIYSDLIDIKSPSENFRYILENPGKVCFKDGDVVHRIPDITNNSKRIIFVPGESACRTHNAIKDIASEYKKNTLMINGKTKGFFKANGEFIRISDYKNDKIRKNMYYTEGEKKISYGDLTTMDIAVIMYNDPSLNLNSSDLVITGFYCVERGVTFNRPNFQFTHALFTSYHYKESSDIVESIIQITGRCFGNKEWVPADIKIISPKYITDTVRNSIKNMIDFLLTSPKSIQYADIYREAVGIPLEITFNDKIVLQKIVEIKKLKKKDYAYIDELLRDAYKRGGVSLVDNNHSDPVREAFSFEQYSFSGKRVLEEGNKADNYRFDKFYDAFTKRKCYGQTVKDGAGHFSIDITMINYTISNDPEIITIDKGTGFISFVYKKKATPVA